MRLRRIISPALGGAAVLALVLSSAPGAYASPGDGSSSSGSALSDLFGSVGDSSCAAVEVVSTPGSWASDSDKSTSKQEDALNSMVTQPLMSAFPGRVKVWETPYPSTVGALAGLAIGNGDIGPSYEKSKQEGVSRNIDHINEVASKCPNTKFALIGYSQGADVAGDTAALIANGRSVQVGPEKVVGVILFADPSRSGQSSHQGQSKFSEDLYAPTPQGMVQKNKEVLVGEPAPGTGMAGPRPIPFTGLEDKVISFCNPDDMACATPEGNNPIRDVVSTAKDGAPGESSTKIQSLGTIGQIMEKNEQLVPKVLDAAAGQNVDAIPDIVSSVNLNAQDVQTLVAAGGEVMTLLQRVPDILSWIGKATPEEIMQQLGLIGGFGITHASYTSMSVDDIGTSAVKYAEDWLHNGIANALNGNVRNESSLDSSQTSRAESQQQSGEETDSGSSPRSAPDSDWGYSPSQPGGSSSSSPTTSARPTQQPQQKDSGSERLGGSVDSSGGATIQTAGGKTTNTRVSLAGIQANSDGEDYSLSITGGRKESVNYASSTEESSASSKPSSKASSTTTAATTVRGAEDDRSGNSGAVIPGQSDAKEKVDRSGAGNQEAPTRNSGGGGAATPPADPAQEGEESYVGGYVDTSGNRQYVSESAEGTDTEPTTSAEVPASDGMPTDVTGSPESDQVTGSGGQAESDSEVEPTDVSTPADHAPPAPVEQGYRPAGYDFLRQGWSKTPISNLEFGEWSMKLDDSNSVLNTPDDEASRVPLMGYSEGDQDRTALDDFIGRQPTDKKDDQWLLNDPAQGWIAGPKPSDEANPGSQNVQSSRMKSMPTIGEIEQFCETEGCDPTNMGGVTVAEYSADHWEMYRAKQATVTYQEQMEMFLEDAKGIRTFDGTTDPISDEQRRTGKVNEDQRWCNNDDLNGDKTCEAPTYAEQAQWCEIHSCTMDRPLNQQLRATDGSGPGSKEDLDGFQLNANGITVLAINQSPDKIADLERRAPGIKVISVNEDGDPYEITAKAISDNKENLSDTVVVNVADSPATADDAKAKEAIEEIADNLGGKAVSLPQWMGEGEAEAAIQQVNSSTEEPNSGITVQQTKVEETPFDIISNSISNLRAIDQGHIPADQPDKVKATEAAVFGDGALEPLKNDLNDLPNVEDVSVSGDNSFDSTVDAALESEADVIVYALGSQQGGSQEALDKLLEGTQDKQLILVTTANGDEAAQSLNTIIDESVSGRDNVSVIRWDKIVTDNMALISGAGAQLSGSGVEAMMQLLNNYILAAR